MPDVKVRKFLVSVEEIHHEGGPVAEVPPRRGAVLAVIENPYAGACHENIQPFMEDLKPLGLEMAQKLLAALGGDPKSIQGYGKGAIVGEAGELEHAALWHAPGGYSMREVLGGAKAIVPSTKKVGGPGHAARHSRHPRRCLLCAQPFRRHRSRHHRCAEGQ